MPEIRRIRTPSLDIAYTEHLPAAGPGTQPPVLLLHGFPYAPCGYDAVVPALLAAGRRVLVPYLRGYGPTRFLAAGTPRSGQQAALGKDLLDLLDALAIPRAVLCGYDWGGRAACVVAALWPERAAGLVTCTGYNIQDIAAAAQPAPAEQEHRWWYQYYFHTERGRAGLEADRQGIARLLWRLWSPHWDFDEATFQASAGAFDNPDFVRGGDPVLPPPLRLCRGRSGAGANRGGTGGPAIDPGADHRAAWRRRRRRPGRGLGRAWAVLQRSV